MFVCVRIVENQKDIDFKLFYFIFNKLLNLLNLF